MKLSVALLAALLPGVAAVRAKKVNKTNGKLAATSKVGKKLLSKARPTRKLDQERDVTWTAGYSIVFDSCHTATVTRGEEGGDEFGALMAANSVLFKLCPSKEENCKNGAEYIVSMLEFVNAYTEYQMEEEEWACEQVRENCYYDDENMCYEEAGLDYCIEYEGQEEFEVQRYLECEQWENNENYFIGPYCGDSGNGIFLGIFQDGGCAVPAKNGLEMYSQYSYGRDLPYSTESIVKKDYISCMQIDKDNNNNNNNNNNGNQDVEILEMCEELYEISARCEQDLAKQSSYYWSPDNEACEYIHDVLPRLDYAAFGTSTGSGKAAKAFAWIFAISTLGLGGYIVWMHTKGERKVDLSTQGGAVA